MRILFATSEAQPLIKTGGLADVAGSLPVALQQLDTDTRLLLPAYGQTLERIGQLKLVKRLSITQPKSLTVRLWQGLLPGHTVPVFLIDKPELFDRDSGGPYNDENGHDWPDNALRFAVLSQVAALIALNQAGLDWKPDIVHCHDWQTGLVPVYLSSHSNRPQSVFTIHNLAYRGIFDRKCYESLSLPDELWHPEKLEFFGQFSFMKGGLVFADRITTVSPTYAEEILTPEFGQGLEGLLQYRENDLSGIINGIDTDIWNPDTDRHLISSFNDQTLSTKSVNKRFLVRKFFRTTDFRSPLFVFIGRLTEQKGVDLILQAMPKLLDHDIRLIFLGTGDKELEYQLTALATTHPHQVATFVGYSEKLAHQLEAGADCFLMPSRFEPCGLNQLYSLRYGTLPLVHRTGGLTDTVIDANTKNIANQTATGFHCPDLSVEAFLETIERILNCYHQQKKTWKNMQQRGMQQSFSWAKSARKYQRLYQELIDLK